MTKITKPTYIGIIGPNGSGKSSVCDYIINYGFVKYSLSDIVRQEVRSRMLSLERDNLTATANILKSEFGKDILAKRSLADSKKNNHPKVVFDSIRNEEEMNYLRDFNTVFIGVTAPIELRFQRVQKRKKETDTVDFATFKKQCDKELLGNSSGQNIQAALNNCDHIIENDGDFSPLHKKIDTILSTYWNESVLKK